MPYRHANYWVAFTIVIIIWGFWGSYFNSAGAIPLAFHVHAITSLLWLGLLAIQIWTINNGKRDQHRILGQISFLLFPLLILGFVMIANVSAADAADPESRRGQFFGASFGFSMLVAISAYLTVFYLALKHRRNVRLHAGYMLTTPLILFESPFSRVLLDIFPVAAITGSSLPQLVLDAIVISMLLSAVFGIVLYIRLKKHGVPFLVAAIFLIVESVTMYFGPKLGWARDAIILYAGIPDWITLVFALFIGGLVAYLGWISGKKSGVIKTTVLRQS